jgi:hypothetical protein
MLHNEVFISKFPSVDTFSPSPVMIRKITLEDEEDHRIESKQIITHPLAHKAWNDAM